MKGPTSTSADASPRELTARTLKYQGPEPVALSRRTTFAEAVRTGVVAAKPGAVPS